MKERKKQVEIERKVAGGKSLRSDYDRLTLLSVGAFFFNFFLFPAF